MDIITVEEAARLLLETLMAIAVGGMFSAPITLFLVSTLKRVPLFNAWSAEILQLAIGLILTVVVWIVARLGYIQQFETVVGIILVVGPALISLFTALAVSSAAYNLAVRYRVGYLSYQRTSPAEELKLAHG